MLPIATLSLVSALTVAPYEIAQQTRPPAPAVTTVLPADAPLVGMINTKAEAWGTLGRFQLFQAAYAAVKQSLPPGKQFDYAKDVEPWLGDQVALVMMPKAGSEQVTLDSSFLMLVPVKDQSRLQGFVDNFKQGLQRRLIERQYKGITILEWKAPEPTKPPQSTAFSPQQPKQPSLVQLFSQPQRKFLPDSVGQFPMPNLPKPNGLNKERGVAIALLPGYIVTANTAKPIEQLIDTPKGRNTLAQNPQFLRTIHHPQFGKALFTLYENPAKFLPLLKEISKDPSLPFPMLAADSISPEQLKEYSTVNGFLSVQQEGLHFQINAYRQTPRFDKVSVLTPEAEKILARMPAATYFATTGRNLNQQWQSLVSSFTTQPELNSRLTTFRNFVRTSTGLDVDRDIMSWINGEYAFFLFPTKGGLFSLGSPNFNLGIGLVLQTSNRPAADTTVKKLQQFVKSFSGGAVAINTRSIKGKPVISWDLIGNSSGSLLAYSWVDNNTIIVTTGFGAIADLVPQPYVLLPKSYNFITATSSLPRPNQGYFYMNMGSFLSWVYGFVPPTSNDQNFRTFKQIIGTIRSFSATSSTTAEREQFDGLVVLAPARRSL